MANIIPEFDWSELEEAKRRDRRKSGLRKRQILFLYELSKAKGPISKEVLCHRAKARHDYMVLDSVGSINPETRARREAFKGYPSLITLGYVRAYQLQVEGRGETVYEITAAGRDALDRLEVT